MDSVTMAMNALLGDLKEKVRDCLGKDLSMWLLGVNSDFMAHNQNQSNRWIIFDRTCKSDIGHCCKHPESLRINLIKASVSPAHLILHQISFQKEKKSICWTRGLECL